MGDLCSALDSRIYVRSSSGVGRSFIWSNPGCAVDLQQLWLPCSLFRPRTGEAVCEWSRKRFLNVNTLGALNAVHSLAPLGGQCCFKCRKGGLDKQ